MATALLDRPPADPAARPPAHQEAADPRWVRPSVALLLVLTGALYLWDLAASGWANSYYAAAVQAGTQSWKAMFFGSLDAGNVITVDKPPASLWVMELSGRIFGFNAWSLLAPQALEGVAAVGLLYLAVKRWHGPVAGLVAGAALALTPAAALMFRFDNPDALLTLLLTAAAYCLVRAIEKAGTRWLLLAGSAIGFAFLTKMLQGFLVLPGFALVYLVAAPTSFWHRVRQLLAAGAAVVVSCGWWVAIVELWPASARPYIGGSTDGTVLDLVLGYNGLGRLLGGSGNGGGGMGGGTSGSAFGGATGLQRLFGSEMGFEIAWLLPAALVAFVALLVLTARRPRTDVVRASALVWGTSLVVTGLVLSYMKGTVHPYYTVVLAPSVAALVAIGGEQLWRRRDALAARIGLAGLVAAAGGTGYVLLARNADWLPALRYAILLVTVVSALGLVVTGMRFRRAAAVLLVAGTLAGLAGPASYSLATAATTHSGSIPSVGPAGSSAMGGMGGGMGGGAGGPMGGGSGGSSGGPGGQSGTRPTGNPPSGGPGGQASTSSELVALLQNAGTTWSAATVGAQTASSLELSTGTSVIAIGGFSGSDAAPTLAQFQQLVAEGKIHYFVTGGGMGGGRGGDSGSSSAITAWVTAHFTASTVGSTTVYDLTQAATS